MDEWDILKRGYLTLNTVIFCNLYKNGNFPSAVSCLAAFPRLVVVSCPGKVICLGVMPKAGRNARERDARPGKTRCRGFCQTHFEEKMILFFLRKCLSGAYGRGD